MGVESRGDAAGGGTPETGKKGFGRAFWMLNSIEMFERLAFYTLRVMAPIYIMQADDPGGLHLTAQQKGLIYAWWAIFQSLLPMATGGFADRYGYKVTMTFSITMMTIGYLLVALVRDVVWLPAKLGADGFELISALDRSNFWSLFLSIMVLATGTAFFKPSIQGSLAHNLHKANSSVGWGIFYWVVNVGAFVGHWIPALVFALAGEHSKEAWRNLFLLSAAFMSCNFLLLFTFKDVPTGADKHGSPLTVLWKTLVNIAEPRLITWLIIMSCFWLMMYQLWDLQPNFISDWIDSSPIAHQLAWLPAPLYDAVTDETPRGPQVPQQVLLSLNSLFIIAGVVGMAWLTRRMRTLTAMLGGMLLATVGVLVAGLTMNPWILILGIVFFSLGEMATGPKKNEYLGLIAPPGKKGLYLGYVNIPVGIGVFAGSWIAGEVYGRFGEKATLALRYIAENFPQTLHLGWNGQVGTLVESVGVPRTEAFARLQALTGLDAQAATELLWTTYSPHLYVWIPFAAIGVVAAVALAIFGQMAKRWADMNA
ncbi:MAG TPA: MFS transporter [Phycisphaerae bacterium]|nr:MFS transporter [Phycisphaerae bacterium]HNU44677.1 MFS transporter [Phycisphaerae bacterium]